MEIDKLRPHVAIVYSKRTPFLPNGQVGKVFFPMDLMSCLLSNLDDSSDFSVDDISSFLVCSTTRCLLSDVFISDIMETYYMSSQSNIYYLIKGYSSGFEAIRQSCISPFHIKKSENHNLVAAIEMLECHHKEEDREEFTLENYSDLPWSPLKRRRADEAPPFYRYLDEKAWKEQITPELQREKALQLIENYLRAEANNFFHSQLVYPSNRELFDKLGAKRLKKLTQITTETLSSFPPLFGKFSQTSAPSFPPPVTGAALINLKPIVNGLVRGTSAYFKISAIYRSGYRPDEMGMASATLTKQILQDFSLSINQIDHIQLAEINTAHFLLMLKALESQVDKKIGKKINVNGGAVGIGSSPALFCHLMINTSIEALKKHKQGRALLLAETPEFQCYALLIEKVSA